MNEPGSVQRLRVTFAKGEAVKYISHLAVMRAWERIFRRGDVPLAYSKGFNPRPKLTFASALSVGYMGEAEVMDVELRTAMPAAEVLQRLVPQLPVGFEVHSVCDVPLKDPALQSRFRYAVYRVGFEPRLGKEVLEAALDRLLSAESLQRQRVVKKRVRCYDLRPLVRDVWYAGRAEDRHVVGMVLANEDAGAGRVDEVADALGIAEDLRSVDRVGLIFDGETIDWTAIRRFI